MGALDRVADLIVHGARDSFLRTLTTRLVGALRSLVGGGGSEARAAGALDMASARVAEQAMGTWAEFRPKVTAETAREVGQALRASDETLSRELVSATGADRPWGLTNRARNDLAEATRGVREVVGRDNVARLAASTQAMQGATDAHVAAQAWYEVAGAAVTRVDMGDDPDEVMRDAVAELARRGLETVDYRSGRRTTVDAAVRRHIDSQLNQAANDMAIRQCEEWGVGLVMVDAHWGARPSHAAWQGKAYSLHGRAEVDGVTYEDLYEATGYQGRNGWPLGAQLAGVNCRHRIYPYVPGESRIPSDDFDAMARKYGMTSEEYYEATQRQRSLERELRAAKREAAFLEDEGLDATAQRYRIGDLQRRLRELCRTTGLERDATRERAYGVTHQPRGLNSQSKAAQTRARQQKPPALGRGKSMPSTPNQPPRKLETMSFDPTDRQSVDEMREWCKQAVMGEPVEHILAMLPDGSIWHSVGDEDTVPIGNLDFNGAIVIHNHPKTKDGYVSFGSDDFDIMQLFPQMSELWAMSDKYVHFVRPTESFPKVSYNDAYKRGIRLSNDPIDIENQQHYIMEWLNEEGYVEYWRDNVPGFTGAEG